MKKLLQNSTDKPIKIMVIESKNQPPAIIINDDKYEVGEYDEKKKCYPLKFIDDYGGNYLEDMLPDEVELAALTAKDISHKIKKSK